MSSFAQTLSKVLGFIIVVGAPWFKLPQIVKIYRNASGEGINIISVILDIIGNTIYMTYSHLNGYPFSQWGEIAFIVLENLAIGILVLHYENNNTKAAALGIFYCIFTWIFMTGYYIPMDVLWGFQSINTLISITSRSLQIRTNYKNGHTGQLCGITANLLTLGSLTRIFTSIQETGDLIIILGRTASAITNGILAGQIWYYKDATKNKST